MNLKLFMSKREPNLLVEDIIDSGKKILEYTSNLSFEDFTKDGKPLTQLSEISKSLEKPQIVCLTISMKIILRLTGIESEVLEIA